MFGEDLSLTYGSVLFMMLKAQYPWSFYNLTCFLLLEIQCAYQIQTPYLERFVHLEFDISNSGLS
ncbi:hypothetical protein HanRHA438_Chr03g0125881 [Helianthus annuus]|nr:hypothetical protein HanRHA438_Chr03g0125881 [Helianthus annuus]